MDLNEARKRLPALADLDDDSFVSAVQELYYPDTPVSDLAKELGVAPRAAPPEPRTLGGTLKDVGVTAVKGMIGVPELGVGLADLATQGAAGKAAEDLGFRPKEARAMLDEYYSPAQKAAFEKVQRAEGLWGILQEAVRNPSVPLHAAAESLPLMGAGGLFARGLIGAGVAGPWAVGAGEGIAMAGSSAEQIRQETPDGYLTGEQSALAGAVGVGGAAFGRIGLAVSKWAGIADIDSMLVGAAVNDRAAKSLARKVLEGFVAEGVLEELPQSVMEQVLQNKALGKPLDEGVNHAAVLGTLAGGLMGGGANLIHGFGKQKPTSEEDVLRAPDTQSAITTALNAVNEAIAGTGAPVSPTGTNVADPMTRPEADPLQAAMAGRPGMMGGAIDPLQSAREQRSLADAKAADAVRPPPPTTPIIPPAPPAAAPAPSAAAPGLLDLDVAIQGGDVIQKSGAPWPSEQAARLKMKTARIEGTLVPVVGGFLIRPNPKGASNAPVVDNAGRAPAAPPAATAAPVVAGIGPADAALPGVAGPVVAAPGAGGVPAAGSGSEPGPALPGLGQGDVAAGGTTAGPQPRDLNKDAPPIITGKTTLGGGRYGASTGALSEGTRRQLMVDPAGGYFWGSYGEAFSRDGTTAPTGEHANHTPALFESGKDARAAAETTPRDKTTPTPAAAPVAPSGQAPGADAAAAAAPGPAGDGTTADGQPALSDKPKRTVTINDQEVELDAAQAAEWDRVTAEAAAARLKAVAQYARDKAAPLPDNPDVGLKSAKERRDAELKKIGMELSARRRKIANALTPKEKANEAAEAAKMKAGDPVIVNGEKATVLGTPFGKVKVRFHDGSEKTVGRDEVARREPEAAAPETPTATEAPRSSWEAVGEESANRGNAREIPPLLQGRPQADKDAWLRGWDRAQGEKPEAAAPAAPTAGVAAPAAAEQPRDEDRNALPAPGEDGEAWWKSLTPTGRRSVQTTAGVRENPLHLWAQMAEDMRTKLLAAGRNLTQPRDQETGQFVEAASTPETPEAPKTKTQIRAEQREGERQLGRVIEAKDVADVRRRLNVSSAASKMAPADVLKALLQGRTGELANGWTLERARVSDDIRVELKTAGQGLSMAATRELVSLGVIEEKIGWQMRYFVPVGKDGAEVLAKLFKSKPLVELSDPNKGADETPAMRQDGFAPQAVSPARLVELDLMADAITRGWERQPPVRVVAGIEHRDVPQEVKEADAANRAKGGGSGVAVFYRGEVWVFANKVKSDLDLLVALHHEVLGHFGLRGHFGKDLDQVLNQVAALRRADVLAMIERNGMSGPRVEQRAAEEVLAYLAQTEPQLPLVQRAIAAIRTWLREHVPFFGGLALSDGELIRNFILPARQFVKGDGPRGGGMTPDGGADFAQGSAPFYSALSQAVHGFDGKGLPVAGWTGQIQGWINKGKVKADEVEWSGLREWLALQDGRVSKEQVAEYLAHNGVRVTEVVKGGESDDVAEWWNDEGGANEETPFEELTPEQEDDARARYRDEVGQYAEGATKYGQDQLQLPGGKNYREVLLTLPTPDWMYPGRKDAPSPAAAASVYRSSHWDEPNVLAHIRLNDRTDAEGKRVLFIEEIQSDFGQSFKKQKDAINRAVDDDFEGIVERMKKAGVLQVECD